MTLRPFSYIRPSLPRRRKSRALPTRLPPRLQTVENTVVIIMTDSIEGIQRTK